MTTQTRLWTIDDVIESSPADQRWELVKGELKTMTPAGFQHGRIAGNLHYLVTAFVKKEKLGITTAAETGFILARQPDSLRAPDVGFVRAERVTGDEIGFYDGPPDFAAEVVSPDDRAAEVRQKTQHWLDAGTRVVWVVWPQTRSVTVHYPGREPLILHEADTLDGGDVLRGFACKVAAIFE